MVLGLVYICTKRPARGIAEREHALSLDRNLAQAHAWIGTGKLYIGRAEEMEAHIGEALRLSPRDTLAYTWMNLAGLAKLVLGGYEHAFAWFQRSIEANRNYPQAHFNLGIALARLDRDDEARSMVRAGRALNPIYSVSRARAHFASASDDPTFLASVEPYLEGLRMAGVPES